VVFGRLVVVLSNLLCPFSSFEFGLVAVFPSLPVILHAVFFVFRVLFTGGLGTFFPVFWRFFNVFVAMVAASASFFFFPPKVFPRVHGRADATCRPRYPPSLPLCCEIVFCFSFRRSPFPPLQKKCVVPLFFPLSCPIPVRAAVYFLIPVFVASLFFPS